MWIFLNDAFLSIVSKDCARDELMVRGRRRGDIEKVFPRATVTRYTKSDYLYRAAVKKTAVEEAMVAEVQRITYGNFKSSVEDRPLHDAYLRVWTEMAKLQEVRPYSGNDSAFDFGEHLALPAPKVKKVAEVASGMVTHDDLAAKGITYSKSHIWRMERDDKFPKRVPIGGNRYAYVESEIDAYLENKIRERDAGAKIVSHPNFRRGGSK